MFDLPFSKGRATSFGKAACVPGTGSVAF